MFNRQNNDSVVLNIGLFKITLENNGLQNVHHSQ
ncbi:hypothetical protein F938_04189 [Acinetobacter bereziniae LMG 1003 = CIP 70.12]|uniref:Uncharacterized protein n=2 Tax=Acinetobacter bereziniae TaxID=106648 RepID=N9CXL0_ACIBZ|nr:hypothetical protein F963_00046 [Acinetobacter bereziniae NIPH 3]ENV90582.1 hypothetical protein F938_04189 [Acinetobacter bereziniae LMG 1003 = CIP 70.12]